MASTNSTLPQLIDYVPPAEWPTSKAPWALDPARSAVLVHDLQRYFLGAYAPGCAALEAALTATARILAAARAAGVPVFYTAQTGDHSDRGLQGDLWGPGMARTPDNTEIVSEVAPAAGDVVIPKMRYSAFVKSDFADLLAGRDQLVLTGVYAGIGVTATAFDAFCRDVQPFLVADGVADFGLDQHVRALDLVAGCCGVVLRADEVVAVLNKGLTAGGSPTWESVVRTSLERVAAAGLAEAAFADTAADLFEIGLNSLQAFDVLDDLADLGVEIDFGEFTRSASVDFLVAEAVKGQGPQPAGSSS